ncbi:MAG: FkbM family methyltransferase [Acidobacteriota bacterium]|nr:FkbM family methyltransferase [Acidobacteriota bacterium]
MVVAHQNPGETDFLYREIFVEQSYLRHGITVAEGDCIFDVGANIGLFTLFVGLLRADTTVYAFEPIPQVFEALRINALLYGIEARLFACGIAEAPGTAEFTYYPNVTLVSGRFAELEEERALVRSLLDRGGEAAAAGATENDLVELLADRLRAERMVCPLRTLSEVIAEHGLTRIDLLKVDVEKAELEALAGVREEDWEKVRQVVVEVHDVSGRLREVTGLLARHGFEVTVEQDRWLVSTTLWNVFARRPEGSPRGVEGDRGLLAAAPRRSSGEGLQTADPGRSADETLPKRVWSSARQLAAAIQESLRQSLPEYMLPGALTFLEALPLLPSGKVDRKALPAPRWGATAESGPEGDRYVAPGTPTEERLAAIWGQLLGRDRVGADDSLFAFGWHSLLAVRLVRMIRDAYGVDLPVRVVFELPTLAAMAAEIDSRLMLKAAAVEPAPGISG